MFPSHVQMHQHTGMIRTSSHQRVREKWNKLTLSKSSWVSTPRNPTTLNGLTTTTTCYVWTFWSKYIKFCMDLDTFIILCRGLLPPEFLSNRLQTLAQWSLGIGEVCYDFSKSFHIICRIYSGLSGSLCGSTTVQLFTCREKPMNESWLLNRGPLSEATRPTLSAPSTFNQLKYRGLYPMMFQCGASVA